MANCTLTVLVNNSAGGKVSGGGTYPSGTMVTVTATPNSGYVFYYWILKSRSSPIMTSSYQFTLYTNETITAYFSEVTKYSINISPYPPNGGQVSGGGTFQHGKNVTISATPNANYVFRYWQDYNVNIISYQQTYSFTASRNYTLNAMFDYVPPKYNINLSASPSNGGNVKGNGTFTSGTTVSVTATPNSGYKFSYWQESGQQVCSTQTYTFSISSARNLTAVFNLLPSGVPSSISVPSTIWKDSRFTVSWSSASNATSYVLERNVNGQNWSQAYSGSSRSYQDSASSSWTYVEYRVKASNSAGESGWRTSSRVYMATLQAPASVTVPEGPVLGRSVVITWTASNGAASYSLQRSANGSDYAQIYSGGATTWNDTINPEWKTVQYKVSATGHGETSSFTSSAQRQTRLPAPPSIAVPDGLREDEPFTVSWEAAQYCTGYVLERKIGDGIWEQAYSGPNITFKDTPGNWKNVQYQAKGTGAGYMDSQYAVSAQRAVVTRNDPPGISLKGAGGPDLGTWNRGFKVQYVITDRENAAVTVKEYMDGNLKRQYAAKLGQDAEFDVSGSYFMRLANGSHEMAIEASDQEHTSRFEMSFSKGMPGVVQYVMDRGRRVELDSIKSIMDRECKVDFANVEYIVDDGERHEILKP